jgi:hypothetical protein
MVERVVVELAEEVEAEQLVHYLDERGLDSAKRLDCDDVVVEVNGAPEQSSLAIVVALEGWLTGRPQEAAVLRVHGRRHSLRPHHAFSA